MNVMNLAMLNKKYLFIGFILGILFYVGYSYLNNDPVKNEKPEGEMGEIVEGIGIVTAYDDKCKVDSACRVQIENRDWITINAGRVSVDMLPEFGKNDVTQKDIGTLVKYKARRVGDGVLSIDQKNKNEIFYLLKIDRYFACSDYCPGDEEQYMKTIFVNITDKEECASVGGKYEEIIGWGIRKICIVE